MSIKLNIYALISRILYSSMLAHMKQKFQNTWIGEMPNILSGDSPISFVTDICIKT